MCIRDSYGSALSAAYACHNRFLGIPPQRGVAILCVCVCVCVCVCESGPAVPPDFQRTARLVPCRARAMRVASVWKPHRGCVAATEAVWQPQKPESHPKMVKPPKNL